METWFLDLSSDQYDWQWKDSKALESAWLVPSWNPQTTISVACANCSWDQSSYVSNPSTQLLYAPTSRNQVTENCCNIKILREKSEHFGLVVSHRHLGSTLGIHHKSQTKQLSTLETIWKNLTAATATTTTTRRTTTTTNNMKMSVCLRTTNGSRQLRTPRSHIAAIWPPFNIMSVAGAVNAFCVQRFLSRSLRCLDMCIIYIYISI